MKIRFVSEKEKSVDEEIIDKIRNNEKCRMLKEESLNSLISDFRNLQKFSKEEKKLNNFGGYILSGFWLIKKSFFTFDFFNTSDICWVYIKQTKQSVNFVPVGTTYQIILNMRSGKELAKMINEKDQQYMMEFVHKNAPWAAFGFSEELKQMWRKKKREFISLVEKRYDDFVKNTSKK